MKYLSTFILAIGCNALLAPAWGSSASGQGPDIESSTELTMKECLALQAAKHNGATRADMRKACEWTTEANGSGYMSGSERPRATDSARYGIPPALITPAMQ